MVVRLPGCRCGPSHVAPATPAAHALRWRRRRPRRCQQPVTCLWARVPARPLTGSNPPPPRGPAHAGALPVRLAAPSALLSPFSAEAELVGARRRRTGPWRRLVGAAASCLRSLRPVAPLACPATRRPSPPAVRTSCSAPPARPEKAVTARRRWTALPQIRASRCRSLTAIRRPRQPVTLRVPSARLPCSPAGAAPAAMAPAATADWPSSRLRLGPPCALLRRFPSRLGSGLPPATPARSLLAPPGRVDCPLGLPSTGMPPLWSAARALALAHPWCGQRPAAPAPTAQLALPRTLARCPQPPPRLLLALVAATVRPCLATAAARPRTRRGTSRRRR